MNELGIEVLLQIEWVQSQFLDLFSECGREYLAHVVENGIADQLRVVDEGTDVFELDNAAGDARDAVPGDLDGRVGQLLVGLVQVADPGLADLRRQLAQLVLEPLLVGADGVAVGDEGFDAVLDLGEFVGGILLGQSEFVAADRDLHADQVGVDLRVFEVEYERLAVEFRAGGLGDVRDFQAHFLEEVESLQFAHVEGQLVLGDLGQVLLVSRVHILALVPGDALGHDEFGQFIDLVLASLVGGRADVDCLVGDRDLDAALALRVLGHHGDVDAGVFDAAQLVFELYVRVLDEQFACRSF